MDDKELLKLAAKAAGKTNWQSRVRYAEARCDSEGVPYWNPLADDGDALRLAVKLGIGIVFGANYVIANGDVQTPTVNNAGDPCAATRQAIVRAAAAIGMAKPMTDQIHATC